MLPAPRLDDRRFQDLVDEAKRRVQQRCPEWTDHNVSDPGVTLIELFAWMTDLLLYRVNRIPDRLHIKFLELIGLRLFPATPARAPVTFWLAAAPPQTLRIAAGAEVATLRTETEEAITFSTARDLDLVPCSLAYVLSTVRDGDIREGADDLRHDGFEPFDQPPQPGNALLLGLDAAVPSCAVDLRLGCRVASVGVDPDDPPLRWDAWTADGWARCEVDSDSTGAFNRDGDVVLHVPEAHEASIIGERRAGWLRAVVTEARPGQPTFNASPIILSASAFTRGGTTEAFNGETVLEETIGVSEGTPGQRFSLRRGPVVAGDSLLEVSEGEGWEEWEAASSFAESDAESSHYLLDPAAGEVAFGPAVRMPDGGLHQHGRVPAKGAVIRMGYRVGGGSRGNVPIGALCVLKSSIPYVDSVTNRRPARDGVDAEDIANARERGAILLRTRDRAVTAEDYEHLAREVSPEVARVRCVPASSDADGGGVRVLVVPQAVSVDNRVGFGQLQPTPQVLERIARRLDEVRVVGARVLVEPPHYRGLTVVARVRAARGVDVAGLERRTLRALYEHFHPISGGPDGDGWPFGRAAHAGDVYSVLLRLAGVESVDEALLFAADPVTGERGQAVRRLELGPNELVFSYEHQVLVEEG